MSTSETCFFRDKIPFEHFSKLIVPEIMRARAARHSMRIWCAAGATGQEPYSLVMCLKEMGAALTGWRIEILATNLSHEAIEKSKMGFYSQSEIQRGLPIRLLVKYFKQKGEFWQINPDIRAMVTHRQINLLHDFSQLGSLDVIFLRDALTGFDPDVKLDIIRRLAKVTEADGFLVLGTAETLVGLSTFYRPHPEHRGIYRPSAFNPGGPVRMTAVTAARALAAAGRADRAR